jgi:hypothetical protein
MSGPSGETAQRPRRHHIAVCVNQARLLASLRYAFTQRYAVVTELMQNARRANATVVAVDYDGRAQRLTVRDDGVGIGDWQSLFTVGGSGWDGPGARAEPAAGVGFLHSLYAARRCTVRSRGALIAFDTAAALRQQAIAVQPAPPIAHTVVMLDGVALPELDRRMAALASAFPVAVVYNGAVLPRPLALDARPYKTTTIGQVHVAGLDDGKAAASILLVLHGLLVYGDARLDGDGNVVHLDPRRFHARLPERDTLVDEAGTLRAAEAVLKALWRARLEEAKRTLPGDVFVTRFFAAAATWGADDLLVGVPSLPGRLFARITGYPIQEGYGTAQYLQALPGLVRREQFASGQLRAVMLPEARSDNFAYWMFARANELLVLTCTWGLAAGHWLWDYVPDLDARPVEVEILGEHARAALAGQRVAPDVILCRAYRVRIAGFEAAEFTAQAMAWRGGDGAQALILVPDGEHGGAAVEQCSSYVDEDDRPCPELAARDRDALAGLIRRLRAQGDGCQLLPAPRRAALDPDNRQGPGREVAIPRPDRCLIGPLERSGR